LFEAPDADRVREVNEAAQLPFTRIVEALDLTPAASNELKDDDLAKVSGGITNLQTMEHETKKSIISNFRV